MSRLPPYSTFRTDKMQPMYPQAASHGNVLSFTPPGFKQCLNVKFPDSRLAVCAKCKKNYKTRDSCRVRSGHTTAPWTTAYICITLDESCTTAEGKYIDGPLTIRMCNWQPYILKTDFDIKTPVCAACKKTNRTRSFCRARHMHRQLPWCTVFVLLSAVESTDPSTVVAAPSRPVQPGEENEKKISEVNHIKTSAESALRNICKVEENSETTAVYDVKPLTEKMEDDPNKKIKESVITAGSKEADKPLFTDQEKKVEAEKQSDANVEGDDINDIDASRTFLVKVSTQSISIHWLELSGEGYTNSDSEVKALNDAIRSPTLSMPPLIDPSRYYTQMGAQFGYPFQQAQLYPLWGTQQTQYNQQMMQWMPNAAASQMVPAAIPPIKSQVDGEPTINKPEEEGDKSESNPLTSKAADDSSPSQASPQELWQAQVMLQHQMIYAQQQHFLGQMMVKKTDEKEGTVGIENDSSPDEQETVKKRQKIE